MIPVNIIRNPCGARACPQTARRRLQSLPEHDGQTDYYPEQRDSQRKNHHPLCFILECEVQHLHTAFRSRTLNIISSNTSVIDSPVELMMIASSAATRGESSRVVSR